MPCSPLSCVPFLAAAQPSPSTEAPREPDWSIGAGVSFGFFSGISSASTGLLSPSATVQVPAVEASLERSVGSRTWLVLGAAAVVAHQRQDIPDGASGVARDDARGVFVSAGVRRGLTRAGAPAEVSVLASLGGGVANADQRFVSSSVETRRDATAWSAGGEIGIAVDRQLTGGLSLRLASPLVGAGYGRTRVKDAGHPVSTSSGFSASARLAPRLELRLAF